MNFRWEAPLTQPLICPHCEAALTLPTSLPARRVLCPRCHGTIPPHPHAPAEDLDPNRIAYAAALDDDEWQRYSKRHLGNVTFLSMIGAAFVLIGT